MSIDRRTFCRSVGALVGALVAVPALLPVRIPNETVQGFKILYFKGMPYHFSQYAGSTIYFIGTQPKEPMYIPTVTSFPIVGRL